jgi:hypothetical protein
VKPEAAIGCFLSLQPVHEVDGTALSEGPEAEARPHTVHGVGQTTCSLVLGRGEEKGLLPAVQERGKRHADAVKRTAMIVPGEEKRPRRAKQHAVVDAWAGEASPGVNLLASAVA